VHPRSVDSEPPGGGRFDEAGDATRRTLLANERTGMAWWRTGLTSVAVGLGVGKVIPELTGGTTWPYTIVGAGYAALGIVLFAYGTWRHRNVEEAVMRGTFARPGWGFLRALTAAGVILGPLTTALIVARP
jgi:putative membrane protein